jgi:hypothetical protein
MPNGLDRSSAPEPLDGRIDIHVQAPKTFAVLRFSGNATRKKVEKKSRELLNELSGKGFRTVGEPFLMRYNSPFMPGFLRTNEVGIEVAGV